MKKTNGYLKPAFSLMEMMVVLLIVAILAAATAPMVTKKMARNAGSGDSPWVFTGLSNDIAYNMNGRNDTAVVGAARYNAGGSGPAHPRFVLANGNDNQPALVFARNNGDYLGQIIWTDSKIALSNATIGEDSVAIGMGQDTGSNVPGIVAIGYGATTGNMCNYATAVGHSTKAGTQGVALGVEAKANMLQSAAIGYGAVADGRNAVALGPISKASAMYSIAIGDNASAGSPAVIAIGNGASASNSSSIAIGYQATTLNPCSIAIGKYANAFGYETIVLGNYSNNSQNDYGSIIIGNQANAGGYYSLAIGYSSKAQKGNGIAIGHEADSQANDSIAIGSSTVAKGSSAVAIGTYITSNDGSIKTNASGSRSVAIGAGANSTGQYSIALGDSAKATAIASTALGDSAKATDNYSTAIGYQAETTAANQIVLGTSSDTVYIPGNLIVEKNVFLAMNNDTDSKTDFKTGVFMRESAYKGDIIRFGYAESGNGYTMHSTDDFNNKYSIMGRVYNVKNSDRRLKNVGEKYIAGLDELKKLEFFHYTFKKDEAKTPHVGVMAQDLQKVFPDAVTKGDDGYLQIRWEDMFYAVINAVKELDTKISEIVENITSLSKKLDEQQQLIETQNRRIDELEARLAKLEK